MGEHDDDEITTFLEALEGRLASSVTDAVIEPVRVIDGQLDAVAQLGMSAVMAGGKRLRPRFAYWAWRVADQKGADSGSIVALGAALEILHAAILVHDDVIDGSDLRRGQPSVRATLAARHRAQSWSGDAGEFGDHTALLLGDLLWSAAHDEFDDAVADLPRERRRAVSRCFQSMRVEVISGQLLELRAQAERRCDAATAEQIRRYKTSAYTVERPVELGLGLAGSASPVTAQTLNVYARAVGHGFQLRDDLADLFGSTETSGKKAGDDIRSGKPTELLGAALELASGPDAAVLSGVVGDGGADSSAIAEVRRIVLACGAADRVVRRIADLVAVANQALADLPGSTDPAPRAGLQRMLDECTDISFMSPPLP
jgi:geranylgeranyl diphosphate synthase type I